MTTVADTGFVVGLAILTDVGTILTTDRRDFEIVKPKNLKSFELLP